MIFYYIHCNGEILGTLGRLETRLGRHGTQRGDLGQLRKRPKIHVKGSKIQWKPILEKKLSCISIIDV